MPEPVTDLLRSSLLAAGELQRIPAGSVLFRSGSRPRYLYWVIRGELRLLRHSVDGGEVILQRCRSGLFAEASLFSSIYHCDGVAIRPTEAIRIARANMDCLLEDPGFARSYVRWLSHSVRSLRSRCERMSLTRTDDRILHALAEAGTLHFGTHHGSLKDWAGELGVSHEALYRALAELEKQGRIVRGKGVIASPDASAGQDKTPEDEFSRR